MEQKKKVIPIKGMHCTSCEILIEKELRAVAGIKDVDVAHAAGGAVVSFEEGHAPKEADVIAAIRRAGYGVGREQKLPWFTSDGSEYLETMAVAVVLIVSFLIGRGFGWFNISLGTSESLSSLPFVFLVGVTAGLSTCMAMVGGLVLGVSARYAALHEKSRTISKLRPQLSFQAGRVGGFFVLGGALGVFGHAFELSSVSIGMLTVFVSVVMLLLGVQLVGLFPRMSAFRVTLPKLFGKRMAREQKGFSHMNTMSLGAGTFFLPCGFTQAMQLYAITRGDFLAGAFTMGVFALGTMPGLLGVGALSSVVRGSFARYFFRFSGVALIALALFNFDNGRQLIALGRTPVRPVTIVSTDVPTTPNDHAFVAAAEPQVIKMTQSSDGYAPSELTVKRGQPVRWVIESKDSYSCAVSLVAPKIGVKKVLQAGENVITFTPNAVGDIPFSCSMGMYRGVIHVIE